MSDDMTEPATRASIGSDPETVQRWARVIVLEVLDTLAAHSAGESIVDEHARIEARFEEAGNFLNIYGMEALAGTITAEMQKVLLTAIVDQPAFAVWVPRVADEMRSRLEPASPPLWSHLSPVRTIHNNEGE